MKGFWENVRFLFGGFGVSGVWLHVDALWVITDTSIWNKKLQAEFPGRWGKKNLSGDLTRLPHFGPFCSGNVFSVHMQFGF